jgi:hypothetical protein
MFQLAVVSPDRRAIVPGDAAKDHAFDVPRMFRLIRSWFAGHRMRQQSTAA